MDGARRRRDALAGLTLGAVLGDEKEMPPPPPRVNRTLLDIIRDEEPNSRAYKSLIHHHHNKKSWKSFKDRLRIKRAGAAWSNVPASDVPIYNDLVITGPIAVTTTPASDDDRRPTLAQLSRNHSIRVADPVESLQFGEVQQAETGQGQVQLQNQSLSRVVSLQTDLTQEDSLHIEHVPVSDGPIMSSRSSMLRRNSSRISSPGQPDEPVRSVRLSEALAAEREQIQRVVSSTEAAGRARQQEVEAESGTGDEEAEVGGEVAGDDEQQQQQVRMSLMDLLEETDRQMGWSYSGGDGDGCHDDDDEEDEAEKEEECSNLVERNCCVCMVRHKGSAFIPCGHTFCRLCSRELWVSRGNCPLCNGFILEILDIF
uniref:RING-type domain-containing protein n=1 Tax=Kalanchoe fedtschenkoi TaxID=63787 RepID=A0A7N0UNW1_KALFE